MAWGTLPKDNIVDVENTTTTALAADATFTGAWVEILQYSSIIVIGVSDQVGTLYYEFSTDASTVDRTVQLSPGDTSDWGIHALAPVTRYGRVRVVNSTVTQTSMSVEVQLSKGPRTIVSRASQVVSDYTDVQNVRLLADVNLDEARGTHSDREAIQKFGYNGDVASGVEEDIWISGGMYTGWLTTADNVRIQVGGNVNDTAAGTGARSVVISGLDENWDVATETVVTAGALASASTTTTFIRVNRTYVLGVGTYGGSNAGDITIETDGGLVISKIGASTATAPAGIGQSQQAMYTVPAKFQAYVKRVSLEVDAAKKADIFFWQRQNADVVAAPYTARRVWHAFIGITGEAGNTFESFVGPFPAKTDIWASAVGPTGGAAVSVEMDIIIVDVHQ